MESSDFVWPLPNGLLYKPLLAILTTSFVISSFAGRVIYSNVPIEM